MPSPEPAHGPAGSSLIIIRHVTKAYLLSLPSSHQKLLGTRLSSLYYHDEFKLCDDFQAGRPVLHFYYVPRCTVWYFH